MDELVAIPKDEYRWITKLALTYLAYEDLIKLRTNQSERDDAIEDYIADTWSCTLDDLVEDDVDCAPVLKKIQLPSGKYIGIVEL